MQAWQACPLYFLAAPSFPVPAHIQTRELRDQEIRDQLTVRAANAIMKQQCQRQRQSQIETPQPTDEVSEPERKSAVCSGSALMNRSEESIAKKRKKWTNI